MNFCHFCFLVCFLVVSYVGLVKSFDFDVCSTNGGENIEVTFGPLSVKCGQAYLLKDVATLITEIRFAAADKTKLYEILMIDPDAPSAAMPNCRSWLHLLMSNVSGSDLSSGISPEHNSYIVTEYNPPGPPKGSGYHRYIVAAFSHEKPLNIVAPTGRCRFDIEEFTTLHKLSQTPNGANMFRTQSSLNEV